MNWFAYFSLITLSAFLLANALAFERVAKELAKDLSAALGKTPFEPAHSELVFPPFKIQEALGPPCVTAWFWLGVLSTVGSLVAGEICLGWQAVVTGIIVAWIGGQLKS